MFLVLVDPDSGHAAEFFINFVEQKRPLHRNLASPFFILLVFLTERLKWLAFHGFVSQGNTFSVGLPFAAARPISPLNACFKTTVRFKFVIPVWTNSPHGVNHTPSPCHEAFNRLVLSCLTKCGGRCPHRRHRNIFSPLL